MNRLKYPCCGQCKVIYHIGDLNGPRIPMLLNCGHDICRNCLKFTFRKNKQVICYVCQANNRIESEDQVNNVPIHFYLVGKVWYLLNNKIQDIGRDFLNLRIASFPSKSLKKERNICNRCYKVGDFFCHPCNVAYCEVCFEEVHLESQMMNEHYAEQLAYPLSEVNEELKCDEHKKSKDFICLTCHLLLCSICTVENHRLHDIHYWKKYSTNSVQMLNEYVSKGEVLLDKLKYYRDGFNVKVQKYLEPRSKKKINDYDSWKQSIMKFVSSVTGALQCIEQTLMNKLDETELAGANSMNKIVDQLNCSINELEDKLTEVDIMLKTDNYSPVVLLSTINNLQNLLGTTHYIAKKTKSKTSIIFNENIFNAIQNCIVSDIGSTDTYILINSPEKLPSDYTVSSKISSENDDGVPVLERTSTLSSISSISSLTSSLSSDAKPFYMTKSLDFNLTTREVTKGDVEAVVVVHVNSPSDFYLQLFANQHLLETVLDMLQKCAQSDFNTVERIDLESMYAVQINNGHWLRGSVIHVDLNEDITKNQYTVFCIDYGFTEIIAADRFKNLPPSAFKIPPLAYNCALYDLKPSTKTGWSNESWTLFSTLMSEMSGSFFMYVMKTDGERIEVDVVWKESSYPLSIRDAMFYLGHGASEGYINSEVHKQFLKEITLPSPNNLDKNQDYSVIISHFVSPKEFYIRLKYDEETKSLLSKIMKELGSIYQPTETNKYKGYLLYTPQIGMAVAARYTIDKQWYRAKITSLPEPRMVTVHYVDFGNSETLSWDKLRVLDKSLIVTPPIAIKATLANIYPANDGKQCDKWSDNARAAFMKLTTTKKGTEDNLVAFVHDISHDKTHKIFLYNRTSKTELCVNAKLVSQGLATALDMSPCAFNKQFKRNDFGKPPIQLSSEKRSEESFSCSSSNASTDELGFAKDRAVKSSENHEWKKYNNNKNIPGTPMIVVKVNSPNEIVLKYADKDLAQLTARMNKAYSPHKNKNNQNLTWSLNDLCAVFIKKYGNWYRGKIVKMNVIKRNVSIYFYDLDETVDEIRASTLYILERTFVEEKCYLVHCSMDRLVPLDHPDENWSTFSCDRLIEELNKYNLVYFAKKGKKNNDIAVGEIWVHKVVKPKEPVEPFCSYWMNMNQFMIDQGLAFGAKLNKEDDVLSTTETEFNEVEHFKHPLPTTQLKFITESFNRKLKKRVFENADSIDELKFERELSENFLNFKRTLPTTNSKTITPLFNRNLKNTETEFNSVFENAKHPFHSTNESETEIEFNEVFEDSKCPLSSTESETITKYNCTNDNFISSKLTSGWLPPSTITESMIEKVIITFVDKNCCIYFQIMDDETDQLLQHISNELNSMFKDSDPLPKQFKWTKGQMVIAKYCHDYSWYRATIIDEKEDGDFTVQLLDYGTIETCSHDDLRSTLYLTDFPQLCFKGFFKSILPLTKSGLWHKDTISFIYKFIIEIPSKMWLDLTKSANHYYAIKKLQTEICDDVCQYLVTNSYAYFDYVIADRLNLPFMDDEPDIHVDQNTIECRPANKSISMPEIFFHDNDSYSKDGVEVMNSGQKSKYGGFLDEAAISSSNDFIDDGEEATIGSANDFIDDGEKATISITNEFIDDGEEATISITNEFIDDGDKATIGSTNEFIDDGEEATMSIENDFINDGVEATISIANEFIDDGEEATMSIANDFINDFEEASISIAIESIDDGEEAINSENKFLDDGEKVAVCSANNSNDEEPSKFPKFYLKNEVIEGMLCNVVEPTIITIMIEKVCGKDVTHQKDEMHNMMLKICSKLPSQDNIIPGTPVVVWHNIFWRRGTISNMSSVFLVDLGISIKLVKKNLKQCPPECFKLPMYAVICRLGNVKSENADTKQVIRKMSKLLSGITLKIVGSCTITYEDDIVDVELYNDKNEIAYQSLIDEKLLTLEDRI